MGLGGLSAESGLRLLLRPQGQKSSPTRGQAMVSLPSRFPCVPAPCFWLPGVLPVCPHVLSELLLIKWSCLVKGVVSWLRAVVLKLPFPRPCSGVASLAERS